MRRRAVARVFAGPRDPRPFRNTWDPCNLAEPNWYQMKLPKRSPNNSNDRSKLRSSPAPRDRVKIFFELDIDEDGYPPATVESLWATSLGEGRFRLENTPFFVTGVSYLDVVRAHRSDDDGCLWFDRLVEISGHSTVRVVLFENSSDTRPIKERMQVLQDSVVRLGCSFEGSHLPNLVSSIDILRKFRSGPSRRCWRRDSKANCGTTKKLPLHIRSEPVRRTIRIASLFELLEVP